MKNFTDLPLFLISSILLVISPGPDFVYVINSGIEQGRKAGISAALGVALGLWIHSLLAAFGLSSLLQASRDLYLIVKYIGAAYLIYIGLSALLKRPRDFSKIKPLSKKTKALFWQGILVNVFNPKAIITFMFFLPQFIHPSRSHDKASFIYLGGMLALIGALWFILMGYFSGTFGVRLQKNTRVKKMLRYISGAVMLSLGLKMTFEKD